MNESPPLALCAMTIEAKDSAAALSLARRRTQKPARAAHKPRASTQPLLTSSGNPPYMGSKGMNSSVKRFLGRKLKTYKSDLSPHS